MADALLINRDDLMKLTGMGGNVDTDRLQPHIKSAQDIHLQPILGTDLYDKLLALVAAGTWDDAGNEVYATLITTYVTPFLVNYTMVDFLPFQLYQIENAGIFKKTSENSITAEESEMQLLTSAFRDKALFYNKRLNDFLCSNSSDYPEYTSNTDEDMYPDSTGGNFQGLNM